MSTGIPGTGPETGQETGPDIGQGTANAGERKTIFDPADRARLRAALIGYMKEHDIGVPALIGRIETITGRPVWLRIPQKTLQRFLAGTHRTNDNFLVAIDEFVRTLPDQAPAAQLGIAIAGFLNVQLEVRTDLRPEPGTYRMSTFNGSFDRALQPETPEGDLVAHVTLEASPYAGVVIMHEQIVNPHGAGATHYPAGYRLNYEGAAIPSAAGFLAVLRNTLNYLPKTYMFAPEGTQYTGHALSTELTLDTRQGSYVYPNRYVLKKSGGEQS